MRLLPARPLLTSLYAFLLCVGLVACSASAQSSRSNDGESRQRATTRVVDAADDGRPLVVLVGIDGFRWDYLDLYPDAAPNLEAMAAEGVRSRGLISVFPSYTFPNFYSIATGLYPDNHGIVANTMYDPAMDASFSLGDRDAVEDPRWWSGEPIWVTAEQQGLTTGTMFWVGSEAPVKDTRPTFWKRYDGDLPNPARIDTVLSWVDRPAQPSLVTLYFSDVDGAGHRYGPNAEGVREAIARVDSSLGLLRAGLEARGLYDQTHIVLVSDHGMAPVRPARQVVYLSDYASFEDVRPVESFALTGFFPRASAPDSAEAQLAAVEDALRGAHPAITVYRKEDVPERYRYGQHRRVPPLLIVPKEGWGIVVDREDQREMDDGEMPDVIGVHGYAPDLHSMHGLFVARGPAFRQGTLVEAFPNIDVYGILARLLDIEPAQTDGSTAMHEALFVPSFTSSASTR